MAIYGRCSKLGIMEFIKTKILTFKQKEEVNELWNNERHSELSDLENYLYNLNDQHHILLIGKNGIIKGWYFDFIRDDEKWFVMILDSKVQGKGLGTALLNQAKKKESELNGWVIDHNNNKKQNGDFYKSPIEFYKKNGFEILSDTRLELEKISAVKIKWKK